MPAKGFENHPIADIYPLMDDDQLKELANDIQDHGLLEPIVLYEGKILDGRNRYRACELVNVNLRSEEFSGQSATAYVVSMNAKRRHLTPSQRAAAAVLAEPHFAEEAKKRQKESGKVYGRGKKKVAAKLPEAKGEAREMAGAALSVSSRYVSQAKKLKAESPEIFEQVHAGKKTLQKARQEVQEKKRKTIRLAAIKDAPLIDDRIMVGDFRKLSDKIPDGSLSLIFTDPPYNRKAADLLPSLASFAQTKLIEGGSLIVYIAHINLHAAMNAFDEELRYWWIICCLHSGRKALMREYGVRVGWKPILWYVKGTRDNKQDIVEDVISGGEEKKGHDWQQAESEAAYWIKKLCPEDGIVCDPFLGSGTTGVAAQKLKRQWIGFEIDPTTAAMARKRVVE